MPICPRCGKSLSTDQALTYHLNRKYKCGSWKCEKCSIIFDTKFDLNIHKMKCINQCINTKTCEQYIPCIFYILDDKNIVVQVSDQASDLFHIKNDDLLGKHIDSINNEDFFRIKKDKFAADIPLN